MLLGHKAGDNTQVLALAESLGWGFEVQQLHYQPWELLSNLLLGPSLAGIRRQKSSALTPPWPDLVITAGRRNEPVARWIRRQADHQLLVVHLGRPWAALHHFDLVVTTPQYSLPRATNVLQNDLPLHRAGRERQEQARRIWEPRLGHLPRPWIALLVGGDSGPFVLDSARLERLARAAQDMAQALAGSLLITTSARTPDAAVPILRRVISCPQWWYQWSDPDQENPYFGYLALADTFIVTGESMSMLAEGQTGSGDDGGRPIGGEIG